MNQILDQFNKIPIVAKLVVLVVIVLAMSFGMYQFRYVPLKGKLRDLRAQKEQLNSKLIENQAVADNLPLFQEEVNVLNEQLKQAVSLLPNEADIHSILRQLSILARKTNVDLQFFRPGAVASRGFYNEIGMDLKIDGTFHDIATYIDQIGKLSRIINISDIVFGGHRMDGRVMRMTVDCRATTFMFRGGV
jgi:type IV pilus assembly protein PilO